MNRNDVVTYIADGVTHGSARRSVRGGVGRVVVHLERFARGARVRVGRVTVTRKRDETANQYAARLAAASSLMRRL